MSGERFRKWFTPNDEQREVLSRRGEQVKNAGKLAFDFLFGSDAESERVVQEFGAEAEKLVRDLRGTTSPAQSPAPEPRRPPAPTPSPSATSTEADRNGPGLVVARNESPTTNQDPPLAAADQLVWCRACGREQAVSTELPLGPALRLLEWTPERGGWRCPSCAPSQGRR
jgi:hypothetical protein